MGSWTAFKDLGVIQVTTVVTEFKDGVHRAVMQMPGTDYEEEIVSQEFQKGFIMGEDTLIRLLSRFAERERSVE